MKIDTNTNLAHLLGPIFGLVFLFKENQPQVSMVSPEERDIACDACEAAVQVVSFPNYGQVLHNLQEGGQEQVQVPLLVTKCKCSCTWSVGQVQVQAVVSERKC